MAATSPVLRSAVYAESGDKTELSTGEQQSGYTAGKPSRRKTNWLLNWLDNAAQWLLTMGLPTYNASATYGVGSRVLDSSGVSWKCIAAGTTGVTPGTDDTKWLAWGHTNAEVTTLADAAADAAIGTLSGAQATGIASSNANVTVGYAYSLRFPGSTVRMLCLRLTFAAGHSASASTVLTLSGTAAFDTGGDNAVATLGTLSYGPGATVRPQIWAAVTDNQQVTVEILDGDDSYASDVTVMVQGH